MLFSGTKDGAEDKNEDSEFPTILNEGITKRAVCTAMWDELHGDAPQAWQHAWICTQRRLRAGSPMQRSDGPPERRRARSNLPSDSSPHSDDHAPSPPAPIALKLCRNVKHEWYDALIAN